jgi:hypothetical protein
VLVDSAQPPFSERLARQLRSVGVKAEDLPLAAGKLAFPGWVWRLVRSRPKIVHYLGAHHGSLFYIVPKLLGKRVAIHWIGSDVLYAASPDRSLCQRLLLRLAYRMADLHLAVSQCLADELAQLGIAAVVLPLVPEMPAFPEDEVSWPRAKRVYVYLPEASQKPYGADAVFRLAEEMADTEFLITSHSGEGAPRAPNLRYLGWVEDMEDVWRDVKVHLRLTEHDGLPQTVIEGLTRGRYVIWSYELPYCLRARSPEEAKEALRQALAQDHPNVQGMAWARETFEPSKVARNLKELYVQLV